MRLDPFYIERIQSEWEHLVDYNLSESGVEPLRIRELLDTPELQDELMAIQLGYSQTNGTIPLRKAIAQYYPGTDHEQILVTNGGAEANYVVSWWLFHENPSQHEFVFMVPNYMQMSGIWKTLGGQVVPFKLVMKKDRWAIDIEALKIAVNDKTVAIAICNPNNPTGAIFNQDDLKAVADIAGDKNAWIISDEIYRGAEVQEEKTPSMHGVYDKTIITSSLSKAYGLPGLRIGWAVCPSIQIANELWTYTDYTTICPSKASDWMATIALRPKIQTKIEQRTKRVVKENWSIIKKWLDSYPDLFEYVPPSAAAICLVKQKTGIASLDLVMRLLKEKSVLLLPGEYFEMPGHLRIGFGADKEYLQQALERVSEFLDNL